VAVLHLPQPVLTAYDAFLAGGGRCPRIPHSASA
jgi:hypothetical protein